MRVRIWATNCIQSWDLVRLTSEFQWWGGSKHTTLGCLPNCLVNLVACGGMINYPYVISSSVIPYHMSPVDFIIQHPTVGVETSQYSDHLLRSVRVTPGAPRPVSGTWINFLREYTPVPASLKNVAKLCGSLPWQL